MTQFPAVAFFPKAVLASARPCTRKRFEEAYLSSRSPIKNLGVAYDLIWEKMGGGGGGNGRNFFLLFVLYKKFWNLISATAFWYS